MTTTQQLQVIFSNDINAIAKLYFALVHEGRSHQAQLVANRLNQLLGSDNWQHDYLDVLDVLFHHHLEAADTASATDASRCYEMCRRYTWQIQIVTGDASAYEQMIPPQQFC